MRKRQHGLATVTGPDFNGAKEFDTLRCNHCGKIFCPRTSDPTAAIDAGGYCSTCDDHVCGVCADQSRTKGCTPLMARIELFSTNERKFREMGLVI